MKLNVYVLGRDVAVLEQAGDFKSVLTYHASAAPDDFVSRLRSGFHSSPRAFRLELPSHPASRRRSCPLAKLRLC